MFLSCSRPLLALLVWWPATLLSLGIATLLLVGRARTARRAGAPLAEAWVPWAVSQLARGATEGEVEEALRSRLGRPDDKVDDTVGAVLRAARKRIGAVR